MSQNIEIQTITGQATATSQELVPANAKRRYLLVQNLSTDKKLFVHFGVDAATETNSIVLGPQGYYECPKNPIGAIQVKTEALSTANYVVLEG